MYVCTYTEECMCRERWCCAKWGSRGVPFLDDNFYKSTSSLWESTNGTSYRGSRGVLKRARALKLLLDTLIIWQWWGALYFLGHWKCIVRFQSKSLQYGLCNIKTDNRPAQNIISPRLINASCWILRNYDTIRLCFALNEWCYTATVYI